MKRIFKYLAVTLMLAIAMFMLTGCNVEAISSGSDVDMSNTMSMASSLAQRQPTPTDIQYSLERYNLIRRAYWVNGMRDRASTLACPIEKPLGYIVLFAGNATVGRFIVDGKVSSLNSFLSPDSEYYEQRYGSNGFSYGDGNDWIADVDGSYGENDNGIFFFTPDGNYFEWTGEYLYSDIPFEINDPIVSYEVK